MAISKNGDGSTGKDCTRRGECSCIKLGSAWKLADGIKWTNMGGEARKRRTGLEGV